jgi:glucose/arabinose dehydrogenase
VGIRAKLVVAVTVVCLGSIVAACAPAKPPPPSEVPPPPPPGGATLPPPPPDQGPPTNSPTLTRTNLVTGLSNPWDLAFLPGDANRFFYTQRSGPVRLRVVSPPGDNLIVHPADVAPAGEAGMMSVAVDPGFASNRFIYTCYTATNDNRVVRWQVNNTLNGVVGAGTVVVQGLAKANLHDGCRIRFGPDGKLWITTGDAAVGAAPQDLNRRKGKVLRINSDGSAPGDNPFVGQPGDDRIYTFGHRNPQGIAFRPGNNAPYSIEHGPNVNDEVNRLVAGGNGGWDPVPGYNQNVPMTDLQKFPDAMLPAWRSGDSGTVAPSGGTFVTGPQWRSWSGALVVAFLKDSRARVMFLDGNGNVSFATRILEHGIRLRSAVQGPDGNLYITTDAGGGSDAIWRVVPS